MTKPEVEKRNSVPARRAAVLIGLFVLAVALRFYGIGRESFWHDEAFSVKFSSGPVAQLLESSARDVHPPLYYLGLHFWRQVVGESDTRFRAYSLVWSLIGLFGLFLLAKDIGGWRVGAIALLLGAVNPLDVYFAQETRMYAQAVALLTLGSWCLWRWMVEPADHIHPSKWLGWAFGYTLCATGALYSHYMSVLVLLAQGIAALLWFAARRNWAALLGYALCAVAVSVAFLPWVLFVWHFRPTLYHPGLQWISPTPFADYFSFLGREFFWGNVGSLQDSWWVYTLVLSLLMAGICLHRALQNRVRELSIGRPEASGTFYTLWLLAGPVILAGLVVTLYHSVYYRPRFAPFILPPFLVLAAIACTALRRRTAVVAATMMLVGVMLTATVVQRKTYEKTSWRHFTRIWRKMGPPARTVFFPARIEIAAEYSLKCPVVSAPRGEIESVLPHLKGLEIWVCTLEGWKLRDDEFDYYQRLMTLGEVHHIIVPTSLFLQVVRVGDSSEPHARRLDRWFAPRDIPGRLEGFHPGGGFHILEHEHPTSTTFRWSGPRALFSVTGDDPWSTVVLNVQFPPPPTPDYEPDLRLFVQRGRSGEYLFRRAPLRTINDVRLGAFEVELPAANLGRGNLWIGWTATAVNLAEFGISDDDRDLGLRVNWIGLRR